MPTQTDLFGRKKSLFYTSVNQRNERADGEIKRNKSRPLDNAIHRINHYPVDSVACFVNTYPLDRDLSGG